MLEEGIYGDILIKAGMLVPALGDYQSCLFVLEQK